MIETILTILDGAVLLVFGVFLSAALAGVRPTRRNSTHLILFCLHIGLLQAVLLLRFSEATVRSVYPIITHLPLFVLLHRFYRKPALTALVSIFTVYLCCQPINWLGIIAETASGSSALSTAVQILLLVTLALLTVRHFAPTLTAMYTKDNRSVLIFGSVPIVYYFYDYITTIYTDWWMSNPRLVGQFFPTLLCISYIVFCVIYYRTYEMKADAERKEQIIGTIAKQRAREVESIKTTEKVIRLLRHDMRLLMNNVALCLENEDYDRAKEMVDSYANYIEGTKLEHYCGNETLNYVLSDFAAKCEARKIRFVADIKLKELNVDEILFSSIISNALDNALNAQEELPEDRRSIRIMMKHNRGKLLISVSNPVKNIPLIVDGMPVSRRQGHGYGTYSIHYLSERLGGSCQFSIQDDQFVLRIVI